MFLWLLEVARPSSSKAGIPSLTRPPAVKPLIDG